MCKKQCRNGDYDALFTKNSYIVHNILIILNIFDKFDMNKERSMTGSQENNVGEQEGTFSFIQEEIVPRKESKVKRILFIFCKTIGVAIVFGVVSSFVFCISGSYFSEIFGNNKGRKEVTFIDPTEKPHPTLGPTLNPEPTKNTEEPVVTATPMPTIMESFLPSEDVGLEDYKTMFGLISDLVEEVNHSVVTVSSIISGIDVFYNPSETTDASYGLIIANNEEELLILTTKSKLEDANHIRVTFSDGTTVEAFLHGYDNSTGIAVLAVPLDTLPVHTLEQAKIATFGDSYLLSIGTPIIALGSPTGYVYSMALGIINSKGQDEYILDYKLELYHTNIPNNFNGEGFIVDFNGEVVGIMTHLFDDQMNKEMTTIMGITKLKYIIEKIVNDQERIYFGVVANDITNNGSVHLPVTNGIYVTDVEAKSPAFLAGLQSGDVIVRMDDTDIMTVAGFHNVLKGYKDKDHIKVSVIRTSKEELPVIELELELGKRKN